MTVDEKWNAMSLAEKFEAAMEHINNGGRLVGGRAFAQQLRDLEARAERLQSERDAAVALLYRERVRVLRIVQQADSDSATYEWIGAEIRKVSLARIDSGDTKGGDR